MTRREGTYRVAKEDVAVLVVVVVAVGVLEVVSLANTSNALVISRKITRNSVTPL
jgi:hypothetical protein